MLAQGSWAWLELCQLPPGCIPPLEAARALRGGGKKNVSSFQGERELDTGHTHQSTIACSILDSSCMMSAPTTGTSSSVASLKNLKVGSEATSHSLETVGSSSVSI